VFTSSTLGEKRGEKNSAALEVLGAEAGGKGEKGGKGRKGEGVFLRNGRKSASQTLLIFSGWGEEE